MSRTRIFLTGVDSLTGSHVLNLLLSDNNLSVRAVSGSIEGAYAIQQQYRHGTSSILDLTVISEKDMAMTGAFDNALNDNADPFLTVVHIPTTPSEEADCLARFINLESETVVNFLSSIQRLAKQVRRVVLVTTLTPFARWLQIERRPEGARGRPSTAVNDPEYILATSRAGNNIVHDTVSKWIKDSGAPFDVVYITAPSCYGPAIRPLETSSDLLEANRRIWNICSNEHRDRMETSPYGITHFLDVRDLAVASVRAIFTPHAGNKRFLISAGVMPSGSKIADFLVACFPELRGRIRMDDSPIDPSTSGVSSLDFPGTNLAGAILGFSRYRSAEETLSDTARQILDLQQRKEWMRIIQS